MTTYLGAHTFAVIRRAVADIVTVSDAALVDTMRFFLERMKIVVEPTGCLAAAAALTGVMPCAGQRVGIVLSGGNIDLGSLAGFLAPRLNRGGQPSPRRGEGKGGAPIRIEERPLTFALRACLIGPFADEALSRREED